MEQGRIRPFEKMTLNQSSGSLLKHYFAVIDDQRTVEIHDQE
jgi:hypothetical protein